jgi:hypothetical protein
MRRNARSARVTPGAPVTPSERAGSHRWRHKRRYETSLIFAKLLASEPEALARWAAASYELRTECLDWMASPWSPNSRYIRVLQVIDKLESDRHSAFFIMPTWLPKY